MSTAIGAPLSRVDGRRKVTGAAMYSAEVVLDGLVEATLVQSTIAAGRVTGIDTAAARAAPGVLAVYTHESGLDLGELSGQGFFGGELRPPLSDDEIHYPGQDVALVVAETFEQSRFAASLVQVAYEESPGALLDGGDVEAFVAASVEAGESLQHRRGETVDTALAGAHAQIEATYTTPWESHNPMEPAATVATWEDGRLTVWDSTQWVKGTQRALASVFDLEVDHVRVICPFVGGGFGCKGPEWPHTSLAAAAARALGRPVKLTLTRAQMFSSVGHRPPTVQRMAAGADADGRLVALRHESICAQSPLGDFVEQCGRSTSKVMYATANAEVTHRIVKTNSAPGTFMRAPGECPGSFASECAMDELAVALGMDPIELRLRNYAEIDPSTGKPFSSKWLRECYRRGAERFGWGDRDPRPGAMRSGRDLVGYGMATAVFPALRQPSSASVRIGADGGALVRAATHDLGTGAYTVFTQVAAETLGLPVERVTFELGDSTFPTAPVAGGSGSSASVSEAVIKACLDARSTLLSLAGSAGDQPLSALDISAVLAAAGEEAIEAKASAGLDDEIRSAYTMLSFGAQFAEVRIDPDFPRVRVSRVVSVMDVGRVLNHKTATSQVAGSVVMGIGMALMEQTPLDARTGRIVGDNLADYAVPVNPDAPAIDVHFIDEPDPHLNTLGVRGVGEIGITGVAAAVANAVFHATGRRVRDLPITPAALL